MSILLAAFAAMGGDLVALSNPTMIAFSGAPPTLSYTVNNDGTIDRTNGAASGYFEDWLTPTSSAPSNYEIRMTLNSGALTSGTTGSWLALTSSRTWTLATDGAANTTVEIRKGSGATLASVTFDWSRTTFSP